MTTRGLGSLSCTSGEELTHQGLQAGECRSPNAFTHPLLATQPSLPQMSIIPDACFIIPIRDYTHERSTGERARDREESREREWEETEKENVSIAVEEQSKGERKQDSLNSFQESSTCSVGFSLDSHLKTGGAFIVSTHPLKNLDSMFRWRSLRHVSM